MGLTDEVGRLRLLAAESVYWLHTATSVIVTIAWAIPSREVWWFALFFIPMMILHWKVADVCILTTWEMRLRGHPDAGSPEQGSFLVRLFGMVGISITFETASRMSYGISYTSLGIVGARLFWLG